jgi:hypothetical protein
MKGVYPGPATCAPLTPVCRQWTRLERLRSESFISRRWLGYVLSARSREP